MGWLQTWLAEAIPALQHYGLPGLFVAVFLESLGLPMPGETMIIVFAAMAGAGQFSVVTVGVTAFAGAVLGDNVGYLIGRRAGRPWIVRHGSRFGIAEARMQKVEAIIARRGTLVVAVARFFPLLRQLNGLAAGVAGMHWVRFLVANVVGAGLWVTVWVALAYTFGSEAHIFPNLAGHLTLVAAAIVVVVLAAASAYLLRRRVGENPNHRRSS